MNRILIFVLTLLALSPAIAAADVLSDLRGTLDRLRGREPIRATLERQTSREVKDDDKPDTEQARVSVQVEDSAEGIRILYPRELLEQSEKELRAKRGNPENGSPTRGAIGSIDALDAQASLNFGPAMLEILHSAAVIGSRAGVFQGRKATILSLKINSRLSARERKHIKKIEETMTIWIGEDGIPLAAEGEAKVKAGFLILTFDNSRKEGWTFIQRGDRLVATRHTEADSGSGLGQKYQRNSTTTVTLIP
ncbi:MAG TPA: hypothetical protein VNM92_00865 [Thermoanaerobaculia bacterium]|nr:hypothetical protein [Thermoanaerobaculia bacterium]